MSVTAGSDDCRPSLANPENSEEYISYSWVNFTLELLGIAQFDVFNNYDTIDRLIQDFDGEILQEAFKIFASDVDNLHLYLNYIMSYGTILHTVA